MKNDIVILMAQSEPIPDVLGGGAERLVTMLIDQNEIDKRCHFIVYSSSNFEAYKKSLEYIYSDFHYIGRCNLVYKVRNAFIRVLNALFNINLLKRGYYDVIAKQLKNKHVIVIDQNGYVPELKFVKRNIKGNLIAHVHWEVNPKNRKIDGLYDGIIGVSHFIIKSWKSNSNDKNLKQTVVYSAVNENRFYSKNFNNNFELKSKLNFDSNDVVILYCGRLSKQKGPKELIETFMKIDQSNLKLLIVGGNVDGSIDKYERNLRNVSKTDSRIKFTGYIKNSELGKYYSIADIQVIPTIVEEAAGLVAIEGMLAGLPIIATNSGGLTEYINSSCALIVNRSNLAEELRTAILNLVNDSELRRKLSENAIIRSKCFTQRKFYNDFVDCIQQNFSEEE